MLASHSCRPQQALKILASPEHLQAQVFDCPFKRLSHSADRPVPNEAFFMKQAMMLVTTLSPDQLLKNLYSKSLRAPAIVLRIKNISKILPRETKSEGLSEGICAKCFMLTDPTLYLHTARLPRGYLRLARKRPGRPLRPLQPICEPLYHTWPPDRDPHKQALCSYISSILRWAATVLCLRYS